MLTIARDGQPIHLHVVEIMPLMSRAPIGSRLVNGIIL